MTRIPDVRVGATPIKRYESWDEHRAAIRGDAERQLVKRAAAKAN